MRPTVLGVLLAVSLSAQDAGMVLRTSAGYNAVARSMNLAPETRERVEMLAREAARASAAGNHGQAMKSLHRGMALMRSVEWTPTMSLAVPAVRA